ncbi:TOBE domain-containing protein [Desulfobulbus rhabdoformis]|uniref:TOBE domain-containing protein n=1 Tax=Desulfobulbus rhabdoformis TaxID=34032 RepID=UPI0019665B54|nr:TOBE domain-containing protein [Desulfobulbus rhabdoformis]MBM9614080.1 TOBE domain-containing protein [Desulfobulbus rhabdoformis]
MRKKKVPASPEAMFLQHMIGGSEEKNPVVALLEEVESCGSINQAAKSVGMSYKAAWERIETINNISPQPLITRQVGGSGGGGTVLTEAGYEFLKKSNLLQREFNSFLSFFYYHPEEAFTTLKTLRRIEMKISARNVWLGTVAQIERGAVNSVVTLNLRGKDQIVSVITENSVLRLGLEIGSEALAIVKAPSVMLSPEVDPKKISARNILSGTISRIVAGVVNDEVTIDLSGGNTVTSILTSESVRRIGLKEGMSINAVIKASDVLLAVA